MSTPTYPVSLPIPYQFAFKPNNQVIGTQAEIGPKAFRRRTRDPGSVASVTFRYTRTEYQQYLDWFRNDLIHGHRKFWINLPSAGGILPHKCCFDAMPQAKLTGHTVWEVTGDLEIVERMFQAPPGPRGSGAQPTPYAMTSGGTSESLEFPLNWPGGSAVNDLAILFISAAALMATPPGWTYVDAVSDSNGRVLSVFYRRATSASEPDVIITNVGAAGDLLPSSHRIAKMIRLSGIITTGDPWAAKASATTPSATTYNFPSIETQEINPLMLYFACRFQGFPMMTNLVSLSGAVTDLYEVFDDGAAADYGHSIAMAYGAFVGGGASGEVQATNETGGAFPHAVLTLALLG